MRTGACLNCKWIRLLIGDLCAQCDPLAHNDDIAVILRIEEVGDDDAGVRQTN